MTTPGVPEFAVATRGLVYFHLTVRTGERDLHSGLFGGAALNATHALLETLSAVRAVDGRLPEPLRAGIAPPTAEERAAWEELDARRADAGRGCRRARRPAGCGGVLPAHNRQRRPRRERDRRRLAGPAEDGAAAGLGRGEPLDPGSRPGQDVDEIAAAVERLLREAAPAGAEVELRRLSSAAPGLVPPDATAVQLAQDAFEHTMGRRPLLVRSGGAPLPIVPALVDKGIPTIVTGFGTPEGSITKPNERLLAEYLPLGIETAKELYRRLAALER